MRDESITIATILAWAISIIGIPSAIGYFSEQFQPWISNTFIISDDNQGATLIAGKYVISHIFLFSFFFTMSLCLILLAIIVFTSIKTRKNTSTGQKLMQEAYNDVCDTMQKVVYQTYNPENPNAEPTPKFDFSDIECIFEINKKGDARVTQNYLITTRNEPAHFWNLRLEADTYAAPFRVLKDIALKATSQTPATNVAAIPLDNRGLRRSIAIFFLPHIPSSSERKFTIEFNWRGWFGELFDRGKSTDWSWSYKPTDHNKTASVTYKFMFSADCGPITCENLRAPLSGDILSMSIENGGPVWIYHNPAAPLARLNWEMRFTRG